MKLFAISAISSGVTAGLVFEADKPNPTPCLADCAWAVPCKHCDRCFQNPTNWINPSDKCKDCFNGWCKLASGCMDCLHDRCGSFSNRCPSVSRYAPCYKTPSLPGCDIVDGDEMLKCGLGLACDRRLFNFIKDEFSPCTGCLAGCSQCRDCIHCIDHPEEEGCDKCQPCEPCIGCAACVRGDCPAYEKCTDCTLCMPCLKDGNLPGCDKCGECAPCTKAIGCFHGTTAYAKYVFGLDAFPKLNNSL